MTSIKVIFRNNAHSVQVVRNDSGRLIVLHSLHSITRQQMPVQYDSGKIAYDFLLPKYLVPYIEQAFKVRDSLISSNYKSVSTTEQ